MNTSFQSDPFAVRLALLLLTSTLTAGGVNAAPLPQGCVSSYSSSSSTICNSGNDSWTCTSTQTCTTVCSAVASGLKSGVQYAPVAAGAPAVRITDMAGNPIVIGGTTLQLLPSAAHTAEARSLYGLISTAHTWSGYRTNVDLPSIPAGTTGQAQFLITYQWPVPVQLEGAVWFSNDGDDRFGFRVSDAIEGLGVDYATAESFGEGCPGSNGTPQLAAANRPVLGSTYQLRATNLSAAPFAFVLTGFSNTTSSAGPLPLSLAALGLDRSCFLLTSPDVDSMIAPVGGGATFGLGIPVSPSLSGFPLFHQVASVDGVAAGGLAVSNGIASVLGRH